MYSIDVPFPVEVPYAMRPHMRPLRADESVLTTDSLFEEYIREKRKFYDPAYGNNVTTELILDAIRALNQLDPTSPNPCGRDGLVWEMTMNLQEDFVIWAPNSAGNLSAQVLSVCLPSGWNPHEKVNKTFLEIHEPIPDFDTVNRAADHIARMITTKGPFVRHVWSISNNKELNRHPHRTPGWTTETLDDMWFRCERQVTIPIHGYAALFLIRVYMQPLKDVFQDPEKQRLVIDSVNSMSDAVIAYKGAEYLRRCLNQI